MNYDDIKTWLSETQRNEFFFQQEKNIKILNEDRVKFKEAYTALRDKLTICEMKNTLTKDTYLEWVKLWKATYAKLSFESRMAKRNRKTSKHSDALATTNHNTVGYLRWYADTLLTLRLRSKEAANAAYLKEKAKKVLEDA